MTDKKMVSYTSDQIVDLIESIYLDKKIILLSPVVKSRKGNYQELFQQTIKKGFTQCRIDGKIEDISNSTSPVSYTHLTLQTIYSV